MDNNTTTRPPSWLRRLLIGRNPRFTLTRSLALTLVCLAVGRFVWLPIRVQGGSMLPTYNDNRINFVNRLAYLLHPPQRGDVVAIRTTGLSIMYMKRIVGLPGETVAFHLGHLVINGKPLEEPYVKSPCDWELPPKKLGPDQYFFVGDNRTMPPADHSMGVQSRERIVGKILL